MSNVEGSVEKYLDSLLSISNHNIPSDISGSNSDFTIMYLLYSEISSTFGSLYPIASYFGPQEQDKLKIISSSKEKNSNSIFYNIELEFSCDLYHDPILRFSPNLWKSIETGTVKFSFSIPG